jgi:Pentapeptide repeats (9 copies)
VDRRADPLSLPAAAPRQVAAGPGGAARAPAQPARCDLVLAAGWRWSPDRSGLAAEATSEAIVAGCSFRDADLRGASFVKAFAHACDFSGAGLKHCNLTRFGTAECDFRHARLRKVRMAGFRGRSGDFRDADLRGAVFIDTTFDGSLMDGAKLDGAAGTLTRRDHVIDVGTPEAPRLLRDDDLLDWFRTAGARVEWFAAPPAPTE